MNEIVPYVYLGDRHEAHVVGNDMAVLCVMWEGEPDRPPHAHQIQTTAFNGLDAPFTRVEAMERAAVLIDQHVQAEKPLLVHCAYGVERSPLTVVWYLMRCRGMQLGEAYTLVMQRHPQTQYRGMWLPKSVRITGVLPAVGAFDGDL